MASSITAAGDLPFTHSQHSPPTTASGSIGSDVTALSDFELRHKRFFSGSSSSSQPYPALYQPHPHVSELPVSSAAGQECSKFFMSSLLNLHQHQHQQQQQQQQQHQQHLQTTGVDQSL